MPAEQNSDEDDVSSSNDERTNVDNLEVDTAGIRQRRITTGSGISVNTGGGGSGFAEDDSEAELISASQQQERTRQKKFSKFFKELQGEVVNIRISCAYVGDILLHGNLYVTENYLAFHSNVFGYVTKIQLPMTTVTSITKEKTAKIIPNAIAVSTHSEKHIFTSFIYRDHTYNLITKSWKKVLAKNNIHNVDTLEDNVDGGQDSSDSETSPTTSRDKNRINQVHNSGPIYHLLENNELSNPGVLRMMTNLPTSFLLLVVLFFLLIILLLSSIYLVVKLDYIQDKMESSEEGQSYQNSEFLKNWQSLVNSRSNKKVQEYLLTNLEQISKVSQLLSFEI